MKLALLYFLTATCSPLLFAEETKQSNDGKISPKKIKEEELTSDFLTLKDPRPSAAFHRYTSLSFDNGVAPKNNAMLSQPILVINWFPPEDRNNPQLSEPKFKDLQNVWQISGLTGYFTQSEVEAILKQVYNLYSSDENLIVPDLIVAGNNWGSGRQIDPVIGELSKKYKFRAYHIAGAFTKATLNAEPEARIKLLKEAQSKIQEGADDVEKPANATKSASEGR